MMINTLHFDFDISKPCLTKGLTKDYAIVEANRPFAERKEGNWPNK